MAERRDKAAAGEGDRDGVLICGTCSEVAPARRAIADGWRLVPRDGATPAFALAAAIRCHHCAVGAAIARAQAAVADPELVAALAHYRVALTRQEWRR